MYKLVSAGLFALTLTLASPGVCRDRDTAADLSGAAEAGRVDEAQKMIGEVLREKPNSAQAHYVHARCSASRAATAKRAPSSPPRKQLAPGLPFAKPESVQKLVRLIESAPAAGAPARAMRRRARTAAQAQVQVTAAAAEFRGGW